MAPLLPPPGLAGMGSDSSHCGLVPGGWYCAGLLPWGIEEVDFNQVVLMEIVFLTKFVTKALRHFVP